MPRDFERERIIGRRALMLSGAQLLLFAGLGARLYQLQVLQGDRYRMLAEDNRISLRLLAPLRGDILDRHGVRLAANRQAFRVVIVSEQASNVARTLDRLSDVLALEPRDIERVMKDIHHQRGFMPVTVRDNLNWEQVTAVEVHLPDLPGIQTEVAQVRDYPFGPALAHVIGYVGAVSPGDHSGEPLLDLPGFRIGKNGLEKQHDRDLRGSAGTQQLEVNAVGRVIRELSRQPGKPGSALTLTLDAELQQFTYQRLAREQSASAVVMDVHTGELLAMASYPGFDPNDFVSGISVPKWQGLLNDPAAPLTHKAIAGQYPPGSTFKMMTALAALEAGVVSPDEEVYCPGHMKLGNHLFHCWKRGGHGHVNMGGALAQSCDVYFYEMAMRLGIDRIADMARRFGLGSVTGIDLPGERPGLVPDREWKLGAIGSRWQRGESLVAAIGQGYMLTTPLQLAVMCARIANGGLAVNPRILRQIGETVPAIPPVEPIRIDPKLLDVVRNGMNLVTNNPRGTAYSKRIREPGMAMAGKTGTAQVRRITMADRRANVRNEDLPWEYRHHALFVGYAPVERPRYACAVVVEHGVGGSSTAAPLARDLLLAVQQRRPGDAEPGEIKSLTQPI